MEIKREEEIEIVGMQYEGRAINHDNLIVGQKLAMKHQTDNEYDPNAVMILTADGKELGYMPVGYASIYAPAIDSGRYSFTVEIIKTEFSSIRPILIVKVTSEFDKNSEEVEKNIIQFVQNIVNGYSQTKNEYLDFICLKTVNINEIIVSLNRIRLLHKIYSLSEDIISELHIEQNDSEYIPFTKEILLETIGGLSADINDVLKKIRKSYNEIIDIDDEEEYQKKQSEIREELMKFRSYNKLFTCYSKSVEEYVVIENSQSADISETKSVTISENAEPLQETTTDKSAYFTESAFFNWLISDGSVSEATAKIYISHIHNVEKLYQTVYGVIKNILGTDSTDDVKTTIETLIHRNEYVDANQRKSNVFGNALSKFVQFAGISVEGLQITNKTKNYQPPVSTKSTESSVTKTVDFENPNDCINSKPCSLIFNDSKYAVKSWIELYKKFLTLLYNDYGYSEIMKSFIGKSIYGRRIDFADKTYLHYLREAKEISKGFFVEINLNAPAIINRIKSLMGLCSIDIENINIEYKSNEKSVVSEVPEKSSVDDVPFKSYTIESFVFKDDVIELMSDDSPEIKEYKNDNSSIIPLTLHESSEAEYLAIMQKLAYTIKGYALTKYAMITDLTDTIKNYIGIRENISYTRHIVLSFNGNIVRTYDCFDALNKICEFSIRYKPFRMARIAGAGIQLNDHNVFYRSNIPVNNCKKLSNYIQVMRIDNVTDLQTITDQIKQYCQINDDMIQIITE